MKFLRTNRRLGRPCRIDYMNIRCAQTRRNRRLLEALQKVVIKLLIGVRLTLQEIVLDQKLVQCPTSTFSLATAAARRLSRPKAAIYSFLILSTIRFRSLSISDWISST